MSAIKPASAIGSMYDRYEIVGKGVGTSRLFTWSAMKLSTRSMKLLFLIRLTGSSGRSGTQQGTTDERRAWRDQRERAGPVSRLAFGPNLETITDTDTDTCLLRGPPPRTPTNSISSWFRFGFPVGLPLLTVGPLQTTLLI